MRSKPPITASGASKGLGSVSDVVSSSLNAKCLQAIAERPRITKPPVRKRLTTLFRVVSCIVYL
jgi:hypothetical protein